MAAKFKSLPASGSFAKQFGKAFLKCLLNVGSFGKAFLKSLIIMKPRNLSFKKTFAKLTKCLGSFDFSLQRTVHHFN